MIFKIFDSDIDKWTSKIGIFRKSFNELRTAINDAFKSVIDKYELLNSLKNIATLQIQRFQIIL